MAELMHQGVSILDGAPGRGSGRYPYGSGKNPNQHGNGTFLTRVEEIRRDNPTFTDPVTHKTYSGDSAVAHILGMSIESFRQQVSIATDEQWMYRYDEAKRLQSEGKGATEIAKIMGLRGESSVRNLLNGNRLGKIQEMKGTVDFLREQVDKKGFIDVGTGVELGLNISRTRFDAALAALENEGYHVYGGRQDQVTNKDTKTTVSILCSPGTEHKDIYPALEDGRVHSLEDYISHDGGHSFTTFKYPASLDSSRLKIRYAEDGGDQKDGLIELRRGVQDLSLGEGQHYAQVRILVDGDRYLKGMARYSDDLPDGVDVIFNTNKTSDKPMREVLKEISSDPHNPFGATIKEVGGQYEYLGKDGKMHLSPINKCRLEGDVEDWSKGLPSQFLAKQNKDLITKQLNLAASEKTEEFEKIKNLTQPTLKKALLKSFADDCDSAAVDLKAASLPGVKYQVILPLPSLRDDEVYAPQFNNGEKVALVRYPHEGIYQIPILTVNNKNDEGRKYIGTDAKDAVGITKKVADRLAGADFDGDTVQTIPLRNGLTISTRENLKGLEGFDAKIEYAERPGMTYMKRTVIAKKKVKDPKTGEIKEVEYPKIIDNTQHEMGVISNLLMDMTLQGATDDELVRATKHSQVVIDAAKHKLDYKRSEKENDIKGLKRTYQHWVDEDGKDHYGGAATLITRAKSDYTVTKRQGQPKVNQKGKSYYDPTKPEGALLYKDADDAVYTDYKTGKTKTRKQLSTRMMETNDARSLSTGTPQEELYAAYANKLKALANEARKEMVYTNDIPYSASAARVYRKEVESLTAKLKISQINSPKEREAQRLAKYEINVKKEDNPELAQNKKALMKLSQQALTRARNRVGAKRQPIDISDREYEAIQAGAVRVTTLREILKHTDADKLRERATPRPKVELSDAQKDRIKAMQSSGYTVSEIAKTVGVSNSTVNKYLGERK